MTQAFRITMVDGPPGSAGQFEIHPDRPTVIGRADECHVQLPTLTIGRRHAALVWSTDPGTGDGHVRLRDLDSRTGTMLNGTRLARSTEIRVESGDLIGVGPFQFRLDGADNTQAPMHSIRLGEENVSTGMLAEAILLEHPNALAADYLVHLLNATESMSHATDLASVADAAVRSLVAATSFSNVAFLLQGNTVDRIDALACAGRIQDSTGAVLVSRTMLRNARDRAYVYHREGGDAPILASESVLRMDIQEAACIPVKTGSTFHGWLYLDRRGASSSTNIHEAVNFAAAIGHFVGLALSNVARMQLQERMDREQCELFSGTMRTLIEAIDAKDPYTRGHSDRVSRFAALLAERAELGIQFVEQARLCGLVHDIGKIGVPEEILRKPTKLEAHEFALIKQHPERGLSMLRDIPQLREILPGVLDHHERWDGQGYPNQSAGMDISQLGRVVGIADAFDAMTSSRLYRPARNTAAALDEIRRCAGTQFDPALAEVFASISPDELEPIMSHRRPTMPVTDAFGT
jgi:hypothetical protein